MKCCVPIALSFLCILLVGCGGTPVARAPTDTPTPTATATFTSSPTNMPTNIATPTETPEPTTTLEPSPTPEPSPIPIPTETPIPQVEIRYQVFPGRTGPSQEAVNQAIEGVQEYLRNSDTGLDDESLELYGVLITQGQYQGQSWFVAGTEDNRYYFWHDGELHALDGSLPGATYSLAGKGIGVFDNGDVEGSVMLKGYAYPVEIIRSGQANYLHILNTDLVRAASDEEAYALLYGPLPAPTAGPCASYLFDDFSNPFLSRLAEGHAQQVYYGIQDGEYHITIRRAQMPFWAGMKQISGFPADFAMVADVRWEQPDAASAAGLLFNIAEGDLPPHSMAFRLYGDGRYGLFKEETSFGPLETAPNFRPYPETNQLGLVRQGDIVTLYLNGVQLAQFTESDWVGRPGLGLSAVGSDAVPMGVFFDNLAVYPPGCWP